MSLPRFSVNNPVLVNMLMTVIIVIGGVLALTMVREMFPEFRPQKLVISTVHPGVAPQEIEQGITTKIEEAVRHVDGVERVDSAISEGLSVTVVTILNDVQNPDDVLRDVKAEIDAIEDLPADAEKTTVKKLIPKLPVISVALYGDGDPVARKAAARKLRDDLLLLPGISDINMSGAKEDEISIEVRPERLLEYDITFEEVARIIRETNINLSGGQLEGERSTVGVRTLGEKQRGEDLKNLVVRSLPDGRQIDLSDVAHIRDEFVESDMEGYYNGKPVVSCVIYKTMSQDAISMSQLIKAYVAGKQGKPFDAFGREAARQKPWYVRPFAVAWVETFRFLSLAVGRPDPQVYYEESKKQPFDHTFQVDTHTDIARYVEGRIDLMVNNGVQGLVLVLLSLVLFLDWRIAMWAALGLPVTFLGTFILMWTFGQTINLVSLMGLIIVVSIDVDEAIVMGENIYRHIEEGLSPREAAIKGAEEVMWPVIVMTGTTIGAFVPLLFIKGQMGDFFRVLPAVVVAALTVSMLDALVILPSHLGEMPDPHKRKRKGAVAHGWQPESLKVTSPSPWRRVGLLWTRIATAWHTFLDLLIDNWYERFIRFTLNWRYVTLAVACATLFTAGGMVAGGFVPIVWVQKIDSETLVAAMELSIGAPAHQTKARLQQLNDYIVKLPEVVNVQMYVAVQWDIGGEGANKQTMAAHLGQIIIELKEASQRSRTSEQILTDLRERFSDIPGINSLTFTSLNGGPAGRSIELRLSGDNFSQSLAVSQLLKEKLATYRGVYDIDDDLDAGRREVRLQLREAARATGITVARLGTEVRGAFYGHEARRLSRNREDVKIMVRYPKHYRQDLATLEGMLISSPQVNERRGWVPLRELADLVEDRSYGTIHRSQQQRAVTVFSDVDEEQGNDSEILASVQRWFQDEILPQYPAVRLEAVGKHQELAKGIASLKIAFPVALLVIYMMLAGLFRSYIQPFVVMIAVPFGVQGAIIGHWLAGFEITFMSLIGLVALNGVVVNDSLVLVDFINTRVREGASTFEACVQGSKLRLRAIILTTITTVVGMVPMIAEQSFQAKFLIPLAITLASGLTFATVLTLVVVPALNMLFYDFTHIRSNFFSSPETDDVPLPPGERGA